MTWLEAGDGTCGGGIWWSKDRKYKNAIANELFLSVAAKLALHTFGKQRKLYLTWADREWRWFLYSGMMNAGNLVNDGPRRFLQEQWQDHMELQPRGSAGGLGRSE